MAVGTICSDFGAPQNRVCHCFHCLPIYLPWSDGTGFHDLNSFLNVEFYVSLKHHCPPHKVTSFPWFLGHHFSWLSSVSVLFSHSNLPFWFLCFPDILTLKYLWAPSFFILLFLKKCFKDFFIWTIFKVFIEFCHNIASVLCFAFVWPWGIWDLVFPTRDRTHIPYMGRRSLNHWTTKEVPGPSLYIW